MAGILKKHRLISQKDPRLTLEIELIQVQGKDDAPRFLVNWREGKSGKAWLENSKTPFPVSLPEAERLFDELLQSRLQQGFIHKDVQWPEAAAPVQHNRQQADKTDAGTVTTQQKALLAQLGQWRSLSARARSRLAWQLGEHRCRAALPQLIPHLQSGTDLLDYCICFAIIRCDDRGAYNAVHELLNRTSSDMVRRIARLAWLQLCTETEAQTYTTGLIQAWPDELQSAWQRGLKTQDTEPVLKALLHGMAWHHWRLDDWLEALYLISCSAGGPAAALARKLVLCQCRTLPVDSLVFRALRRLWKSAEMRQDAELFGVLSMRFEITPARLFIASAQSSIFLQQKRRYVRFQNAVQQEENQLCFSNLTRDYFRRRAWRTLRRLAMMEPKAYPAMATGILLAAHDKDAPKPFVSRHPHWDADTRRYNTHERHHSPHSRWLVFSQILFREDPSVCWSSSGLSWWRQQPEAQLAFELQPRTEAFADLWNAQPACLMQCLTQADIPDVKRFAARALADLPEFLAALSVAEWEIVLQQGEHGLALAWHYFKPLLEAGTTPANCAVWFLRAVYAPATDFLLNWITANPAVIQQVPEIPLYLALHPDARCQHLLALLMPRCEQTDCGRIIQALNQWLSANPSPDAAASDRVCVWIQQWFQATVSVCGTAETAVWEHALQEANPRVKRIALILLSMHPQWQAESCIRRLPEWMAESDPDLRVLAATLCMVLPRALMYERTDLIAFLACAQHASVRKAIWPLLYQLETGSAAAGQLARALVDSLFRALPDDAESDDAETPAHHLHQEIVGWMQTYAADVIGALDTDLQWRLLQARSAGAQLAGFWLLEANDSTLLPSMTTARWVSLAKHPMAAVRQRMLEHIRQIPLREHPDRLLWLDAFNSPWPELRSSLIGCWEQQLAPEDWTLPELMHCCDHPYDDIQRFARQLLTSRFSVEESAQWLAELSQHPSESMQLFVSQWLEQVFAATPAIEKISLLTKLMPYFLSVLSRVNRSRITRIRIQHLLHTLAAQQADLAQRIIPLYVRLVATQAVQDKASYILGLTEILQTHPQLAELAEGIVSLPQPEIRMYRRGEPV